VIAVRGALLFLIRGDLISARSSRWSHMTVGSKWRSSMGRNGVLLVGIGVEETGEAAQPHR
jgi:hypothetical protein